MTKSPMKLMLRAWNKAKIGIASCRAAMLQAGNHTEQHLDMADHSGGVNEKGNSPVIPDCWCRTCRPITLRDMRFVVCPECGNKRCPHANDHRNACTGSNEPGQEGSAYPAAPHQGAEPVTTAYKLQDDFICMLTGRAKYLREKGEIKSPELLERAAAALQGESVNTPPIPNGWKLVPIDPTKDMLRAGQSVVGFWLNTVHCYSKMLAAAPEAPQQEVK